MGKITFGQIGHKLQKSNSLGEIADGNGGQVGPHFLCAIRTIIFQVNLSSNWRQVDGKKSKLASDQVGPKMNRPRSLETAASLRNLRGKPMMNIEQGRPAT